MSKTHPLYQLNEGLNRPGQPVWTLCRGKRQPVFLFTRGFCTDVNKNSSHTSPQRIERLKFAMWKHCVLCAARSAFLNIICENFRIQEVKITFKYPSTCLLSYLPELREMHKQRYTNPGQLNAHWCQILASPQHCGTGFMSSFWHLEFWGAPPPPPFKSVDLCRSNFERNVWK
jgi:hypothetical protein